MDGFTINDTSAQRAMSIWVVQLTSVPAIVDRSDLLSIKQAQGLLSQQSQSGLGGGRELKRTLALDTRFRLGSAAKANLL